MSKESDRVCIESIPPIWLSSMSSDTPPIEQRSKSPKPDDLITVREASIMVGRSLSTLRAWVRGHELMGYRASEDDPSSRLLVSRQELLLLAATNKPMHPGGPRPTEAEAPPTIPIPRVDISEESSHVPLVALSKEPVSITVQEKKPVNDRNFEKMLTERLLFASITAERDGLRALVEAQKLTIQTLEHRCHDLAARADTERLRAQDHKDRLVAAESELKELRSWHRLPWYRRLIGGPINSPSPVETISLDKTDTT